MPRPNKAQQLHREQHLVQRIAQLREREGWSYAGLAKRMSDVGYPMQASAIHKIEKADPPRRIVVEELIAFAEVFGVPVQELLLPPEAALHPEVDKLLAAYNDKLDAFFAAEDALHEAEGELGDVVRAHPDLDDEVLVRWISDSLVRAEPGLPSALAERDARHFTDILRGRRFRGVATFAEVTDPELVAELQQLANEQDDQAEGDPA